MSGKRSDLDLKLLNALAEPNRMKIVELLRGGPLTVSEIAERLHMRQPQTSKHLKVLSNNGIIVMKAEANRRIYMLRSEPFCQLNDWVTSIRHDMELKFVNLEQYLRELRN